MTMKLLGIILLIVGTTIGGGMLALPIATSEMGFYNSSLLLIFCWFVMTAGALLILEVTLWLPKNTNIITMSKRTLGPGWQAIAWITYLLLLYSVLAAYIAGGTDLLGGLFNLVNINLPSSLLAFIFTITFGYIVYSGIRVVDLMNRFLMIVKLGAFLLLILFLVPHVSTHHLSGGVIKPLSPGITVTVLSFGYATIIPSLRNYFHDDVNKLRIAILAGSLIPLICYIAWDFTTMGVIPSQGENGLISMLHSGRSTSEFVTQLSALLNKESVTTFAHIFTSVCLLTSFLGVALCLSDFLADGLSMEKIGWNNLIVCIATLLPPLCIVLINPGIFISALAYGGIYCMILLVLFPAMMAWRGRYVLNIAKGYQVTGGKPLLLFLMIIAVAIITQSILGKVFAA